MAFDSCGMIEAEDRALPLLPELSVSEWKSLLERTIPAIENSERFNMTDWDACIFGHANALRNKTLSIPLDSPRLRELFGPNPNHGDISWLYHLLFNRNVYFSSKKQAVRAIRRYLSGKRPWHVFA